MTSGRHGDSDVSIRGGARAKTSDRGASGRGASYGGASSVGKSIHPTLCAAVRAAAKIPPWTLDRDSDLDGALAFLGWEVDGRSVLRAGHGTAIVLGTVGLVGWTLVFGSVFGSVIVATTLGLGVVSATRYLPQLLATARRTSALGAAPGLVSRAVLRMRLSPTPETAAAFAASTTRGRLGESLRAHVRRARGSGRSGLSSFADEWAAWFPALRRALTLVESAGAARSEERERALDNALEVVLDGTRETTAEFAASVSGPATALYAFGVLLPLALVALLPTAGTVGLAVPLHAVVLGYDVLLPVVLLGTSAWLLSRRPVAFPPPNVDHTHPDVPDRRSITLATAPVCGATVWWLVGQRVATWTAWIAGPAVGIGVGLVVLYHPMAAVRARVEAVESDLSDGLYLVGREVSRGRSVETALDDAVDLMDSATGEVFADATRQQRQLRVGVRESFLGEHGALATVPSQRARGAAELLAVAGSEGQPAGPAIVAMADHLEDLRNVERGVRRDLGQVTETLSNTATVFGPLVGGATITLAEQMSTDGPLTGAISPSALGLAVGAYVVALAVILTVLATGLERGLERSLVGYRVGRALVVANTVFVVSLVATRTIV